MSAESVSTRSRPVTPRIGVFSRVLLIFAGSVALRCLAATQIAVMFNDGPRFLGISKLIAEARWSDALQDTFHPLYPIAVAGVEPLAGSWDRAAIAVSVLAGGASVVALYCFVRSAFSERAGLVAAALAAMSPYLVIFSADVQSEGLYFAFFFGAVAALWPAVTRGSWAYALLGGVLSGCAYLTRPEGIGVVLVGVGCLGLRVLMRDLGITAAARCAAAAILGAAFIATPYVLALHDITGEWLLTGKKSVAHLVAGPMDPGSAPPPPTTQPLSILAPKASSATPRELPAPRPEGRAERQQGRREQWGVPIATAHELAVAVLGAFRFETAFVLILGLAAARGRPSWRAVFITAFLLCYGVVVYGLGLHYGYISRRHVLGPVLLLLGYAAEGSVILGSLLLSALRSTGVQVPSRPAVAACVGVAIVGSLSLPMALAARREGDVGTRAVAEWMRSRGDVSGVVGAFRVRTAFYAGQPFVDLSRFRDAGTLEDLHDAGVQYLIVKQSDLARYALFQDSDLDELRVVHMEGEGEARAALYELLEPRRSPR